MLSIVERLLLKFDDKIDIINKKRICKWKGCTTILSRYDYREYCFFHYDLLSEEQKHPKRRYTEGKILNRNHKIKIKNSIKLWWKERKLINEKTK